MLYNRLLVPHNTLDRHCLFAATFPPPESASGFSSNTPLPVEQHSHANENDSRDEGKDNRVYTLLFADRSRHEESQIWIFNPLVSSSTTSSALLTLHMQALILFLKQTSIPSAPGQPFSPVLRFASLAPALAETLTQLTTSHEPSALLYKTEWNHWTLPLNRGAASPSRGGQTHPSTQEPPPIPAPTPPAGLRFGSVPPQQLDVVLSTTKIPRQLDTLLALPTVALLEEDGGKLVAWCYIGIDGAIATLFVQPAYREKGLGLLVAQEAVRRYSAGELRVPAGGEPEDRRVGAREENPQHRLWAFDGACGWTYADVAVGNRGSESVMRRLGAVVRWQNYYIRIDSDLLFTAIEAADD